MNTSMQAWIGELSVPVVSCQGIGREFGFWRKSLREATGAGRVSLRPNRVSRVAIP